MPQPFPDMLSLDKQKGSIRKQKTEQEKKLEKKEFSGTKAMDLLSVRRAATKKTIPDASAYDSEN